MTISQRKSTITSNLTLILLLTACGSVDEAAPMTDALDGVPELSAIQMNLTDATSEEGAATEADLVDPDDVADELELAEVPETAAQDLVAGQRSIRELNQALRSFLGPIVQLVRTTEPDHQLGGLRVWGPVTRGNVEYRLLMRNANAGQFSWRLDARSTDSNGKFQRIALGKLARGSRARRGRGGMGVDLDALREVNEQIEARGKVLIGFRHADAGTTVAYALKEFAPDAEGPTTSALLRGVHLDTGLRRLRLAYQGDVPGSETTARELVLARLRHQRGLGGRSDLLALGGDVPEGQLWVRSQCWTAKLEQVFAEVQLCPAAAPLDLSDCVVLESDGDVTACDKGLRDPELPPTDPEAPMVDSKDPNADVEVPTDLDELSDPEM